MSLDEIVGVITTPPPKVPDRSADRSRGPADLHDLPGGAEHLERGGRQTGLSAKRLRVSSPRAAGTRCRRILPRSAGTAEGFLFPETYQLVKKGLTEDVGDPSDARSVPTEAESLDLAGGAEHLGLTPYEVVIVASMIEREAQVDGGAAADRERDLQPAGAGDAARDRRDPPVRRPHAGRPALDGRHRDRHPLQHEDQRRAAADADREPGCARRSTPALAPGGHALPLLRALPAGRRRRPSVREDPTHEHLANVRECLG